MTASSTPDRAGVVVIGAGIAGLATAFDLITEDPELNVVVLEADARAGGKIRTTPFDGLPVDEGADAFLARVPWAWDLCQELGLTGELTSPATGRAYIYSRGALRAIPTTNVLGVPLDMDELARSGIVSPAAVTRAQEDLARRADLVTEKLRQDGADESIGALIRRRLGDEINERLVDPLIGGIYAGDTDQLSLEATAPQFADAAIRDASLVRALTATREQALRTADNRPVFYGDLRGTGHIVDALVERLRPRVRFDNGVTQIERTATGYRIHTHNGDIAADAVVVTTPAPTASKLLRDVAPAAAQQLAAIDYSSVALVALAIPRRSIEHPLDASGFLVPKIERTFITACSWASTKWAHLGNTDNAILRVSAGHVNDASPLALADATLTANMLADLHTMMGRFDAPTALRVTRWPSSFPQYRPGHRARVKAIEIALENEARRILVAGAAYGGIGIPATINNARTAATKLRRVL